MNSLNGKLRVSKYSEQFEYVIYYQNPENIIHLITKNLEICSKNVLKLMQRSDSLFQIYFLDTYTSITKHIPEYFTTNTIKFCSLSTITTVFNVWLLIFALPLRLQNLLYLSPANSIWII